MLRLRSIRNTVTLVPDIPVGHWVDPTVNGNGKGFPRLVEPPAVMPAKKNPINKHQCYAAVLLAYWYQYSLSDAPLASERNHQ